MPRRRYRYTEEPSPKRDSVVAPNTPSTTNAQRATDDVRGDLHSVLSTSPQTPNLMIDEMDGDIDLRVESPTDRGFVGDLVQMFPPPQRAEDEGIHPSHSA